MARGKLSNNLKNNGASLGFEATIEVILPRDNALPAPDKQPFRQLIDFVSTISIRDEDQARQALASVAETNRGLLSDLSKNKSKIFGDI
jgi:hypothetical protein